MMRFMEREKDRNLECRMAPEQWKRKYIQCTLLEIHLLKDRQITMQVCVCVKVYVYVWVAGWLSSGGRLHLVLYTFFLCNWAHQKKKRRKQWKNEGENKFECMIQCIQPDAVMIPHPQPVLYRWDAFMGICM